MQGTPIEWEPVQPLIFTSNCDDDNLPRHAMSGVMPIWSDSLIKTFRKAGVDNIQTFPATITGMKPRHKWTGYNAVNIVGMVDATDENLS